MPLFRSPPFRMSPGLPPTPGKLRVVGGCFRPQFGVRVHSQRIAREGHGAGHGTEIGPGYCSNRCRSQVPLNTSGIVVAGDGRYGGTGSVGFPNGGTSSPCLEASTFVVVRVMLATGVALTWLELAVSPPGLGIEAGHRQRIERRVGTVVQRAEQNAVGVKIHFADGIIWRIGLRADAHAGRGGVGGAVCRTRKNDCGRRIGVGIKLGLRDDGLRCGRTAPRKRHLRAVLSLVCVKIIQFDVVKLLGRQRDGVAPRGCRSD